jgi:hypothetical protein
MDDACEYLWRLHSEEMTYVRHVETQRSTIATVLIPISSAILAAIAFQWKETEAAAIVPALSALLLLVGLLGVLFVGKLYELYREHTTRARVFRKELSSRITSVAIEQLRGEADARWKAEAPYLRKVPVHVLWLGPHIITLLLGVLLLVVSTYRG